MSDPSATSFAVGSPVGDFIRLKCYLGTSGIRVVRVSPSISQEELLLRLSAEFATPVKLFQYEDEETERVTVGPDFWTSEAVLVYRQLTAARSSGTEVLASLKLFLVPASEEPPPASTSGAPPGRSAIVASLGSNSSNSPPLNPSGEAPPLRTPPPSPPSSRFVNGSGGDGEGEGEKGGEEPEGDRSGSPKPIPSPLRLSGSGERIFVSAAAAAARHAEPDSEPDADADADADHRRQDAPPPPSIRTPPSSPPDSPRRRPKTEPDEIALAQKPPAAGIAGESAGPVRSSSMGARQALLLNIQKRLVSTPQKWARAQKLGKGGFGTVYMGLNTETGDVFAVKQQELEDGDDERARKLLTQYDQEIQMMKSLEHPNIVKYLGATIDGGVLNIFMEYIGGGSLSANLAKVGRFSENMIRVYGRQVLAGIAYLHSFKIMHRDIKCANILLDTSTGGKAVLKLTDFGCSKKLADSLAGAKVLSVKGTPFFMAPEVLTGEGYDAAADIWSFGCALVEMATGKPPWSSKFPEPSQAMYQIQQGAAIEIPSELSAQLKEVLSLCLTRDPKKRATAVELLAHSFFSSVPVELTSSDPPPIIAVSATPTIPAPAAALATASSVSPGIRLPPILLGRVLSMADLPDVARASLVCKAWAEAARDDAFWRVLGHEHFQVGENLPPQKAPAGTVCRGRAAFVDLAQRQRRWRSPASLGALQLKGHERDVSACLVVCTGGKTHVISASEDKKIRVWSVRKARCSKTLKAHSGSVNCLAALSATPTTTTASPYGSSPLFCSGSDDCTIKIWSSKASRVLRTISRGAPVLRVTAIGGRVFSLCKSAAVVLSHDYETGAAVEAVPDEVLSTARALHADGSLVAAGLEGGAVRIWDLRSEKPVATALTGHRAAATAVRLAAGERLLVSGSADATVRRWDLRTTKTFCTSTSQASHPISALWFDQSRIFTASDDGLVRLINPHSGTSAAELGGSAGPLLCIDASEDGAILAAGGRDKVVHVWTSSSLAQGASSTSPPSPPSAHQQQAPPTTQEPVPVVPTPTSIPRKLLGRLPFGLGKKS